MGSTTLRLLLCLVTVGSFWLVVNAAASPEELALRNAILSPGKGSVVLKKNVVLTADLPQLPTNKTLKVSGRCGTGGTSKCTISGGNNYRHFFNSMSDPAFLTLDNVIITATKRTFAAVQIGGEGSTLSISKCQFISNPRALELYIVNGLISNSEFSKHTTNAVYTTSEEGLGDDVKFTNSSFLQNKAAAGQGGGAIFVGRYASVTLDKCTLKGNSADYRGGALRLFNAYALVTGTTFANNTAQESGGAVTIYNSGMKAVSSSFVGNVAVTASGGAVRLGSETQVGAVASFSRCSFLQNKTPRAFGAAFQLDTESGISFCSSTLSGNTGREGVISNGYVVSTSNTISTNPATTIPAVTVASGAVVTYNNARCT